MSESKSGEEKVEVDAERSSERRSNLRKVPSRYEDITLAKTFEDLSTRADLWI